MKELSIEEKAKRYDEILARAKGANIPYYKEDIMSKVKEFVNYLLPELKESEDERMVKFIKNQLFNIKKTITENYELDAKLTNAIDWLEKQGEQKPDSGSFWEGYNTAKEKLKQKPAWSEEDEIYISDVMWCIEQSRKVAKNENDIGTAWCAERWVKSLKDKFVPQPQQEWSEEDEKRRKDVLRLIKEANDKYIKELGHSPFSADILWLKSLKDRYTWKPSERKIQSVRDCALNKNIDADTRLVLDALYQDLKKLREDKYA